MVTGIRCELTRHPTRTTGGHSLGTDLEFEGNAAPRPSKRYKASIQRQQKYPTLGGEETRQEIREVATREKHTREVPASSERRF